MKNKDIKKLLKSEYEELKAIPISSKIKKVPIQEKPPFIKLEKYKPQFLKLACVFASCFIVLLLAIIPTFKNVDINQSELTSYILEINPTLCITTDSSDEIISICSLSDDGDMLLSDNRLNNIVGDNLDDGIKSLVDASFDLGYFENYDRRIVLFAINNKESFAFEKTRNFEQFLNKHLEEKGLDEIKVDKGCMSIPDFKHRMNFHNNFEDLDKMREDLKNRPKFFNSDFIPPPHPFYY